MDCSLDLVVTTKVESFLDELQRSGCSAGRVTLSSDPTLYKALRKRWSTRSEADSPVIVCPVSEQDIAQIVRSARQVGLDVGIRCGGHSAQRGASTETGVQIHMASSSMQSVRLDTENKMIHVGGGCLWDTVYTALAGSGLVAVGGGV